MLTQERLKELLHYNEDTGVFTRIVGRPGPRARKGDVAGTDDGSGYIRIYVDGKGYKAHRLAWFYMYGYMPEEVDHENLDRSDNRKANLRDATHGQNQANGRAYSNNALGLKGVSLHKPNGKYKAQIQANGKKVGLGYYATPQEAHAVYAKAAAELHGEFARAE